MAIPNFTVWDPAGAGPANSTKLVTWTHVTVTAADAVPIPALRTITSAVATLQSDPGDDPFLVSCSFSGNTLTIKTWKNTGGTDPTPAAASTFSKNINMVVIGY